MEQALCEVCKDIKIGKILIQTNLDTGEPEVSFGDNLWYFKVVLFTILRSQPDGSVISMSGSWPGGCEFKTPIEANFLTGVFLSLSSAIACEKSSRWLRK